MDILSHSIVELTDSQGGHEMTMAWKDAEISFHSWCSNFIDLLTKEKAVRGHHF